MMLLPPGNAELPLGLLLGKAKLGLGAPGERGVS